MTGHKIGSVHVGRVSYSEKEHFFHLDDKFQEIRKQLKESVDIDILGLKRQSWDPGVSLTRGQSVDLSKHLFNVSLINSFFRYDPA